MSISEFVESKTYKNIMKYVYGWGASIVLLGALFKIQHYPGASIMLVAGMGTEVLIFFLSAFEPLHEEPDWTLVYPELAGMTNDFDGDISDRDYYPRRDSRLFDVSPQSMMSAVVGEPPTEGATTQQPAQQPVAPSEPVSEKKTYALERFDQLLEQAELGPELFTKMGDGILKLADTADGLNKMSDAAAATEQYSSSMLNASESAKLLNDSYNSSNEVIQSSATSLSESTLKAAEQIEKTGEQIAAAAQQQSQEMVNAMQTAGKQMVDSAHETSEMLSKSYEKMVEEMNGDLENIKQGNQTYMDRINLQNDHLSTLNSIYEMQMQSMTQYNENSQKVFSKANDVIGNFSAAVDDTNKYREQLAQLTDNLNALNSVYGNMLSSFNLKDNE